MILNKETILAEFEIIGNPKPYMDSDKSTVRASADSTWRICPGLVIVLLPKMQVIITHRISGQQFNHHTNRLHFTKAVGQW